MLTPINDVNQHIMLNAYPQDLVYLCQTNKMAHQICHNESFWLKKFQYDGYVLPQIYDTPLYWLKAYITMNHVYHILDDLTLNHIVTLLVNQQYDLVYYIKLLNFFNVYDPIYRVDIIQQANLTNIKIKIIFNDIDYKITFMSGLKSIPYKNISQSSLIQILFHLLYQNIIIDII